MAQALLRPLVVPTDGVLLLQRQAPAGLPQDGGPEQLRGHGGPHPPAEEGKRHQALHPREGQGEGLLLRVRERGGDEQVGVLSG